MAERGGFSMPLSMCKAGETVHVVRVKGAESMKRHLGNLGFVEGAEVRVVNQTAGDIILTVKGARLGLDAKSAMRVMVA